MLSSEGELRDQEEGEKALRQQKGMANGRNGNWNVNRATSISTASQTLSLGSSTFLASPSMKKLGIAQQTGGSAAAAAKKKPMIPSNRVHSPKTPKFFDSDPLGFADVHNHSLTLGSIDSDETSIDGTLILQLNDSENNTPAGKTRKTVSGSSARGSASGGSSRGSKAMGGKPILSASMSALPLSAGKASSSGGGSHKAK